MVGEARLTAHGSGAALVGGAATPDVGTGVAGAVIDAVAVVVACGVLATVESPDPQPLNVAAINARPANGSARRGSDHTPRNRTVIDPASVAGVTACPVPTASREAASATALVRCHGNYDGRFYAMRTTIDAAGRLVIPKRIRDRLGLRGNEEVEITERDGRIEIEPAPTGVELVREGSVLVARPERPLPPLTDEIVRETLDRVRR